jgi:hypothetical protein
MVSNLTFDTPENLMICDLMIQSVEHRFGSVDRVPHNIE